MKTYKKPYSRVILLDTEDVMQMQQFGGASIQKIENARVQTMEVAEYTTSGSGGGGGAIIEGDSKGWDCWE